jgi:hypothetical protein
MSQDPSAAIDELLVALERLTEQAKERAREARVGVERHTFAPYHAYRAAIAEYEALVSVIEGRLAGMPAGVVSKAREKMAASRRRALTLSIKAAFNIFFALSAFASLPIGVREVFNQELRHLNDAKTELRSPVHAGKLAPDLEQDLETAEMILNEVIEKAPSLVDFGFAR